MYADQFIVEDPTASQSIVHATLLRKVVGIECVDFDHLVIGDIHSRHASRILSYVKEKKFAVAANKNHAIRAVLCSAAMVPYLRADILPLICDDPNWAFFTLIDHLAKLRRYRISEIKSPITGAYVSIAESGVKIGEGLNIDPFVTVHSGTVIGNNVTLRSGVTLGIDSFQHQRTSHGMISPKHDGSLWIGDGVEIGAQTTISKGFSYRATSIGDDCKIDAGVYIGHGVSIGKSAIICAGVKIMGHCRIGDDVFIGPGAVVSSRVDLGDGSQVSLGSVVTKNVGRGEKVSGNFAVPHASFMEAMKGITSIEDLRANSTVVADNAKPCRNGVPHAISARTGA